MKALDLFNCGTIKTLCFSFNKTIVRDFGISFVVLAGGENVTVATASKDQTVRLWKVIEIKLSFNNKHLISWLI